MSSPTGLMGIIGSQPRPRSVELPRSRITRRLFKKTVTFAQRRDGNISTVTVTTNLAGTVYYHWYVDGVWVAVTTSNYYTFVVASGEQSRVEVEVSQDPGFDHVANAPDTPAARVTLYWIRSTDSDVRDYKVEQQLDGGDWSTIATVPFQSGSWDYRILSPRLDDLGSYAWRVTPVDTAGNDGSTTSLGARTIVRTPDAPDFTATFDEGTTKVTFAEAA